MPHNAPPVLVLIHGLLSTPQEFSLLLNTLKRDGIEYRTLLIPGFTEQPHYEPNTWDDWLTAVAQTIEREVPPNRPIVIGGLCVGGALGAAFALNTSRRIDGLILLSPTFRYDGWGLSRWRHLRWLGYALGLSRFIRIKEREPFGVKNVKVRKWVAAQMQAQAPHLTVASSAGPSSLPLWGIREGERMMANVETRLDELNFPTLVMHAREDEICSLASVQALFQRPPARDKRLVVLENSYHMVTLDNDRIRVANEMGNFVKALTARRRDNDATARTSTTPGIDMPAFPLATTA